MKTPPKTATVKRGRPAGAATKRINTRFPAMSSYALEILAECHDRAG